MLPVETGRLASPPRGKSIEEQLLLDPIDLRGHLDNEQTLRLFHITTMGDRLTAEHVLHGEGPIAGRIVGGKRNRFQAASTLYDEVAE